MGLQIGWKTGQFGLKYVDAYEYLIFIEQITEERSLGCFGIIYKYLCDMVISSKDGIVVGNSWFYYQFCWLNLTRKILNL